MDSGNDAGEHYAEDHDQRRPGAEGWGCGGCNGGEVAGRGVDREYDYPGIAMRGHVRSLVVLLLTVAAATAAFAVPAVAPKPGPGEGRLVAYEVTLREAPATDAAGVLLGVAATHHGIVTELDAARMRAVIMLPSSRGAGLAEDPLVKVSSPGVTSGQRIDRLKPETMTTRLWNSGTYQYDAAGNITGIGSDSFQYDAVNRLTSSTVQGVTQTYTQTYTYDAFGNRLTADGLNHGCAGGMDCAIAVSVDAGTNQLKEASIAGTSYPAVDVVPRPRPGPVPHLFCPDAVAVVYSLNSLPDRSRSVHFHCDPSCHPTRSSFAS